MKSLAELMIDNETSTAELAAEIGYSLAAVSKWREGRVAMVSSGAVAVLAEALGCSRKETLAACEESRRRFVARHRAGVDARKEGKT